MERERGERVGGKRGEGERGDERESVGQRRREDNSKVTNNQK